MNQLLFFNKSEKPFEVIWSVSILLLKKKIFFRLSYDNDAISRFAKKKLSLNQELLLA